MRPVSPQPAETGRVRLGGMCIAMQRQAHRLTRPAGGAVGQPAVQESLIWSQTYWPDDGRLEAAYMHAHMRRFDELWVFAAPASSLGLNAPPLHNTDVNPATPFIPSLHGLSNQQVKDIVMSNFAASSNRRCLPAIPATPPIPPHTHTHLPPSCSHGVTAAQVQGRHSSFKNVCLVGGAGLAVLVLSRTMRRSAMQNLRIVRLGFGTS
jgi:hypothetical protein